MTINAHSGHEGASHYIPQVRNPPDEICRVPQKWEELTPAQFPARLAALSSGNGRTLLPEEFYSLPSEAGSDTYYSYKLSELVEFISDCRVRMDRFILAVPGLKAPENA